MTMFRQNEENQRSKKVTGRHFFYHVDLVRPLTLEWTAEEGSGLDYRTGLQDGTAGLDWRTAYMS